MEEHISDWVTPKKILKKVCKTHGIKSSNVENKCTSIPDTIFRAFDPIVREQTIYTLSTLSEDVLSLIFSFETLELLNIRYTCKYMKSRYEEALRRCNKDKYKSRLTYRISTLYLRIPDPVPKLAPFQVSLYNDFRAVRNNIQFSHVDLLDEDNWYMSTDNFPTDEKVWLLSKLVGLNGVSLEFAIYPFKYNTATHHPNIPIEDSEILVINSSTVCYNGNYINTSSVALLSDIKKSYTILRTKPRGRHGSLRNVSYYFEL